MLIRKKYRISVTYLSLACLSIFFLLPQITGSTELNKTAKAHLKLAEIALENSNFDEVIKLPRNGICLASNKINKIQSLYFEINDTKVWGLQYLSLIHI